MARTANINVRTEPQTKSGAEAIYSNFGLSLSDAINVFLNMSIIEGGFPFSVKQLQNSEKTTNASRSEAMILIYWNPFLILCCVKSHFQINTKIML